MRKILFLLMFAVLLDFIPVEFAVNIKEVDKNAFVCSYTQSTGADLYAAKSDNVSKKEDVYFESLSGNLPYKYLSKVCDPYMLRERI